MTRQHLPKQAQKRLRWPLFLTGGGFIFERLWLAFWPFLSLALAALAIFRFWTAYGDAPSQLWQVAQILAVLTLLAALIVGVHRFRWPSRSERMDRLDKTLPGRPISALLDDQATDRNDEKIRALWQAHQARMTDKLARARPVAPQLRIAPKDPYALRLVALTGAVMALGFLPWGQGGGLGLAVPNGPGDALQASASWEGWIEPPAYTGRPSLYLPDQPAGPLAVPAGSRLTLRLYGDLTEFSVTSNVSNTSLPDLPRASYLQEIEKNGTLSIKGPSGGEWQVTAIGDVPPSVRIAGELRRRLAGDFTLGFIATDDYGVQSGSAEGTLDLAKVDRRYGLTVAPEPRDAIVVDLPLPYRGGRQMIDGMLEENQSEHAWAGLPISLRLRVEDGASQVGQSAPVAVTLPARRFLHPVARALVEQRRDLLWSRANAPRVAQVLRASLNRPDDLRLPGGTYMTLRSAIRRLESASGFSEDPMTLPEELRDEIAAILWDVATQLEDRRLEDARAHMQEAQERLEQAMRDGATPEELSELLEEFREAMRDFLQQKAEDQANDPENNTPPSEDTQQMTEQDLEDMMRQIEEAIREGRMDDAMEMMEALRQMMENAQVTQNGQSGQQGGDQRQALQDTLRQQQGLSDQAFRDLQEQGQGSGAGEAQGNEGRDGGQGRGQSHDGSGETPGQPGQGDGGGDPNTDGQGRDLAEQQRDLQGQLDEQRRNLPGVSDEAGQAARESLEGAGEAMGEAADALENGDLAGALDRQAEAIEAMREGLRQFDEAMENQLSDGHGEQGSSPGQGERSAQRDPLGRSPNGNSGSVGTDSPLEDREDIYRRAQELMEELRERSGDTSRPELERDYLKRLLDQF